MKRVNRRVFGKALVSGTISASFLAPDQRAARSPNRPSTLDGRDLSEEEQTLMQTFLQQHETLMAPVRKRSLPNDLPPATRFSSIMTVQGR